MKKLFVLVLAVFAVGVMVGIQLTRIPSPSNPFDSFRNEFGFSVDPLSPEKQQRVLQHLTELELDFKVAHNDYIAQVFEYAPYGVTDRLCANEVRTFNRFEDAKVLAKEHGYSIRAENKLDK